MRALLHLSHRGVCAKGVLDLGGVAKGVLPSHSDLYTLNTAVPYIFLATYRFNSGEQGLAYINFGIRVTPSLVIVISVAQHKTRKIRTTTVKGVRVKSSVEATLQLIRIGGLVLPIGILWWVWPLQTHVHWIGP